MLEPGVPNIMRRPWGYIYFEALKTPRVEGYISFLMGYTKQSELAEAPFEFMGVDLMVVEGQVVDALIPSPLVVEGYEKPIVVEPLEDTVLKWAAEFGHVDVEDLKKAKIFQELDRKTTLPLMLSKVVSITFEEICHRIKEDQSTLIMQYPSGKEIRFGPSDKIIADAESDPAEGVFLLVRYQITPQTLHMFCYDSRDKSYLHVLDNLTVENGPTEVREIVHLKDYVDFILKNIEEKIIFRKEFGLRVL